VASYEAMMKKRLHVAMELVDTERLFVASLRLINDVSSARDETLAHC
jgi:hypothetical protein